MTRAIKKLLFAVFLALVLAAWLTAAWTFWAFYLPYLKIKQRLKNRRDVKYQILRIDRSDIHLPDADRLPRSHGTPGESRETN